MTFRLIFVYPRYRQSATLPPSDNCQAEPPTRLVPLSVLLLAT